LAAGLRVNVNSISRWAIELQNAELLTRTKLYRGWRFQLVEEIPSRHLADGWRFNNSELTRRVRGKTNQPMTRSVDTLEKREWGNTDSEGHSRKQEKDTLEKREWEPKTLSKNESGHSRKTRVYRSRMNKKKKEEEEKQDESESGQSGKPTAQSESVRSSGEVEEGEGSQSVESNEEQRTYVAEETQPEDPSELMEDDPPIKRQPRRKKRGKRAPSPALVSAAGDTRRSASGAPGGPDTVQVGPPPPTDPEDVLALLRGEVEEKYGAKAIRGMPMELTRKDRGMVRNVILAKFPPDVVISMVRVLVWDWEVARSECFPFRPQVPYPTVEALVQYQESLASSVETGLNYSGTRRGAWNTYANRYLKEDNPLED
jgi:hypothetical protein